MVIYNDIIKNLLDISYALLNIHYVYFTTDNKYCQENSLHIIVVVIKLINNTIFRSENMDKYIGHPSQVYSIEEHRLVGGKGDGIRLLQANNGNGLMFTVSADRCGDLSRIYYKGYNLGFMGPCGYVAPAYYDNIETGFLSSFTAGFLTTCGLTAVGSPCDDNGERLPLHGSIGNTPAENISYYADEEKIYIKLVIRDAALFARKLLLVREYECPIGKNEITIKDTVTNEGYTDCPYMILYHFNMGYPLLCEDSVVEVASKGVVPRNDRAAEGLDKCLVMEKPQMNFEEQCYYYDMTEGKAKITNPRLGFGVSINYDINELPFFTEWKLMECGQYVLGLEPGNCNPDGRDVMRKNGTLKILAPKEKISQTITIKIEE